MTTTTPQYGRPAGNHSIQPASGFYGIIWPASGAIPQSFSSAGWTKDNLGFAQQTFLGASIRSFNLNGGFGDSSSQLSVELVNDEFNKSDGQPQGLGDDTYHNGLYDTFAPPPVGSPVFFKFGMNHATVEQAYLKSFDDIYGTNSFTEIPPKEIGDYDKDNFTELGDGEYVDLDKNKIYDNKDYLSSDNCGQNHLTFGGILQSYVQNRGPAGNPLYSVQVVDPREILSNTVLVLNNYAGTIFQHSNMFNVYGFLEYNVTEALEASLSGHYKYKDILSKNIDVSGQYSYSGYDVYSMRSGIYNNYDFYIPDGNDGSVYNFNTNFPPKLPITGTGYARRSSQGIPYYRLRQGMNALLGIDGPIPQEYITAGFGGYVNFRGYNYVIDFGGLKPISDYYFFDFDQINVLDLCLEICEITSSDLFVTLLPVIDHSGCKRFNDWNDLKMREDKPKEIVAGIIRVDAIDRSIQPEYGAIKRYIDNLASQGIYVENQDVGFELSNVTTDKFVVGAQEVDMYYFSANADRDDLELRKQKQGLSNQMSSLLGGQWTLETSLKQQILPYYGLLGNHGNRAVTIPKGFGAYQQILLDATSLSANGVGNYYVATEMELRAALVSYERWSEFLKMYNDSYMESLETDDELESAGLLAQIPENAPVAVQLNPNISNNYGVTVPRAVFDTDQSGVKFSPDGLPSSPCNPPYGYPLYYKRATKIGIQDAGRSSLTNLTSTYNTILTNLSELSNASDDNFANMVNSQWTAFTEGTGPNGIQSDQEQAYYTWLETLKNSVNDPSTGVRRADVIGLIDGALDGMAPVFKIISRLTKKTKENSLRVYNFVKQVAEECLGRKFLVRIPNEVNLFYSSNLKIKDSQNDTFVYEYEFGPFGFRPRSINYDPTYEYSTDFQNLITEQRAAGRPYNNIRSFLQKEDNVLYSKFQGALRGNWNPITEEYEFNYEPCKQGGYANFDLYENVLKSASGNIAIAQGLMPKDMQNFISENNRMSAYVRFDNSQHISLDGLSADSFTQQAMIAGHFVPDITSELDNTKTDKFVSFGSVQTSDSELPKTIAFVKCDLDDKFYMAPKTVIRSVKVYGQKVRDIGKYKKPNKIYDCATNSYKNSFSYYEAHYVPTSGASDDEYNTLDFKRNYNTILNGDIIDTEEKNLDTEHVYALITLPARISPTMDARFKDSTYQQMNPALFKHLLSLDVVKGLQGFDIPTFHGNPPNAFANIKFDPEVVDSAVSAYKAAMSTIRFGFPQRLDVAVPSPVYPDLVVLPLMSKERCYGPWVSSQSDVQASIYQNVAGRVEFSKDENLAPWNYSGYQLMNAAGNLQVQFSNSLLLQSERGGFVFPSAPSGISLGKALLNAGPLVTNLSIDVSEAGVKTTCKMDLYTAKFGKIQKQKQDMISNISRQRQKLQDERNSLIRKGLGKNATRTNYGAVYNSLSPVNLASQVFNQNARNIMVGTVTPRTRTGITGLSTGMYGEENTQEVQSTYYEVDASYQSPSDVSDTASAAPDPLALENAAYNSASLSLNNSHVPTALDVTHKNMPHLYDANIQAKQGIYYEADSFDYDLTTYEV